MSFPLPFFSSLGAVFGAKRRAARLAFADLPRIALEHSIEKGLLSPHAPLGVEHPALILMGSFRFHEERILSSSLKSSIPLAQAKASLRV